MRQLPTLKELIDESAIKADQNDLNVLLNQPPLDSWIKKHPLATGVKYIPIERIEYLLTRLFIRWHVEVKNIQIIANSIVVVIRLHYQDRLSDQILWQDGIGAAPIQIGRASCRERV